MSADLSPSALAALADQYEVLRELGRGGTAVVYLARERATGTEVAIKVIRSKYMDDEEALARFAREARLVEQLQHPNIVPVRAVLDLDHSTVAIVMKHLTGRTLRQVLSRDGFLPPQRAERVMRDIARALAAAHALGFIHRDVKPENIFIEDDGGAVLADFGLARSMTDETELTMHGVTLGTPAYMAPEQIDGGVLDGRADIYSLGLVGWEMLSGRRPWDGKSLYAILYHQKHEVLSDVRALRDGIPDTLAEVIARSIEKEPDARWRDVGALLAALDSTTPNRISRFLVPETSETMRFVRTPTAPMLSMTELTALIPNLEASPQRRVAPISARTAFGVVVVCLVAVISALVYARLATAPRRVPEVLSGGDIRRPVELRVPTDSLALVRRDSSRSTTPAAVVGVAPPLNSRRTPSASDDRSRPATTVLGDAPASLATNTPPLHPIVPSVGLPTITAPTEATALGAGGAIIAAGGMHSCFINAAGRALCWGSNDQSQLGVSKGDATRPVAVESGERFATIAAGLSHSCAVTRDGSAWCWGRNDHGQLGNGSRNARLAPGLVADAHVFRVIAAGMAHTCGLDAYSVAWCWGSNVHGQLGDSTARESAVPVTVSGGRFAAIVAGWNFTCGLTNSGQASCWGDNTAGQLGDGSTSDRRVPVTAGAALAFTSIAAGGSHVCGVTAAGEAYCWGQNTNGQLGDGTSVGRTTPVRVRTTAHLVSITAGGVHTCAVADDGAAYCWGRNTYGELGTGKTVDEWLPTIVADGHAFVAVRAFGSHTCGVTVAGEPFCWGNNLQYQLGDGTRTNRMRPVRVDTHSGG